MRRVLVFVVAVLLVATLLVAENKKPNPADEAKIAAAEKSSQSWLALLDKADYAASWDEAASYFKDRVTKDAWTQGVKGVREPLGKLVSRKLLDTRYTTSLPGAPDGEYVVLHFDTTFENKKSATETVVPTLDKDGQWRVSGYFVK
jgi:Protein of unknown function (DUF4019)